MKFLKKTGIYFILVFFAIALGSTGYILESTKNKPQQNREIIQIPDEEKFEMPSAEIFVSDVVKTDTPSPTQPQSPPASPSPSPTIYTLPVKGKISKNYSETEMFYSKTMDDFRTHTALDFVCNSDEKIAAAADGTVSKVYTDDFLGLCVHIKHSDGVTTKYCSLSSALVNEGTDVKKGDFIGTAGSSASIESADGVHLHLEAEKDGKCINPIILTENTPQ